MSQENVESYWRGVDAYNRRDLAAFLDLMDPDIEFVPRLAEVEGGGSGHPGIRSWWQDESGAFEEIHMEVEEVLDRGTWIIAIGTTRMSGVGSGAAVDASFVHALRWRDGKCVRLESFRTLDEALEAAGLRE